MLFDTPKSTSNLVRPDRLLFLYHAKKAFYGEPVVEDLEAELCKLHGVGYCVACCSGFMTLELAIRAIALDKPEVITPSLTYRRMDSIIKWAGKAPVFCEVDSHTLGVSAETVFQKITENTALILAAHPIVNLCDIDGITRLSEKYTIPVVFDSVEAAYAEYHYTKQHGKSIGSFPEAEVFSVHASKFLNGCEGGYLTTNNSGVANKIKQLRQEFGYGMNPYHAAMTLTSGEGYSREQD